MKLSISWSKGIIVFTLWEDILVNVIHICAWFPAKRRKGFEKRCRHFEWTFSYTAVKVGKSLVSFANCLEALYLEIYHLTYKIILTSDDIHQFISFPVVHLSFFSCLCFLQLKRIRTLSIYRSFMHKIFIFIEKRPDKYITFLSILLVDDFKSILYLQISLFLQIL